MHKLLARQLRKHFSAGPPEGEDFTRFSAAVDEAYTNADDARVSVERSLELMSNELLERNEQLQAIVNDKHGGTISFDSEDGSGTCFRVALPVDAPTGRPSSRGREESHQSGLGG